MSDEPWCGDKHALSTTAISELEAINDCQKEAPLKTTLPLKPTGDKSAVGIISKHHQYGMPTEDHSAAFCKSAVHGLGRLEGQEAQHVAYMPYRDVFLLGNQLGPHTGNDSALIQPKPSIECRLAYGLVGDSEISTAEGQQVAIVPFYGVDE